MFGASESGNSQWWSVMISRTLDLKGQASGRLINRSVSRTSCRDFNSRNLIINGSSAARKDRSVTPACSTTHLLPFVGCSSKDGDRGQRAESAIWLGLFLKRIMDLVLSTIVLVLLCPLMLAIAIAIKLESPGRVIYRSLRVGKCSRKFDCYKFRTMIAGSDGMKENLRRLNQRRGPFFKIADDPRLTRLGRFLRKYSLDELPQFWNVLKGDMSLVGPRPHPLDDVERYSPWHHRRLDVKPGLTGLWQVTARADPSFETCMVLDLGYIRSWSLLLDCRILMRTIPAVLAGEG
jgi:lipopolysaccharide/colanic/teichoic acid biosynthesis glycosyltransferase